ncbi:MAG: hypothetical protein ACYCZB_05055 [Acidiphilium sp.]
METRTLAAADFDRRIATRLDAEWRHLVRAGAPVALAALAAARAAAQSAEADGIVGATWIAPMARDVPPATDALRQIARHLAARFPGTPEHLAEAEINRIRTLWTALGTAEAIMETGGDIRLLRDPQSDLNGYGCSHRPRPWAITFASSTASSISERGYAAADRARLSLTAAMLIAGDRVPLAAEAVAVRRAIGREFGVAGGAVVLAASGTDSELLALALSHLAAAARPITTILLAPEETGSGVPIAATGRHFAVDTANGHDVSRAGLVEGYRADTALVAISLRDAAGATRDTEAVEADIRAAVSAAVAAGRRVILHALDLSKTGLLAPSLGFLRRLRAEFADSLDIVVDACQLRIAPARVRAYLELDAVVQITGSKFLTGPPFAGAALLPPAIARRLAHGALPKGLDAYFSRGEWPASARVARALPEGVNYGLLLRWRAALAEHRAFAAVDDTAKATAIERFGTTVRQAVARHDFLVLQNLPTLCREGDDQDTGWDCLRSIYAFAVAAPEGGRLLGPAEMRHIYRWLNADCAAVFELETDRRLAARICHIGQPVALPNGRGGEVGWLRVSAGARLISGEPSHRGLGLEKRLDREMADLAAVFDKIALLRANWSRIANGDPQPRYRETGAAIS